LRNGHRLPLLISPGSEKERPVACRRWGKAPGQPHMGGAAANPPAHESRGTGLETKMTADAAGAARGGKIQETRRGEGERRRLTGEKADEEKLAAGALPSPRLRAPSPLPSPAVASRAARTTPLLESRRLSWIGS